jgi:hypothetical protein
MTEFVNNGLKRVWKVADVKYYETFSCIYNLLTLQNFVIILCIKIDKINTAAPQACF